MDYIDRYAANVARRALVAIARNLTSLELKPVKKMQTANLLDPATGNSASVLVGLGFNCFEWKVNFADGPRDLLWAEEGFASGEKRPSSSGIPLLFPFPGRISGGRFDFGGKTYLVPHEAANPNAIHGFIYNRPWRLVDQTESSVSAAFQASVDDPSILNHWPSDFSVEATYALVGSELHFDATFSNTGYDDLPWGFGTHAYFRLPLANDSSTAETSIAAPVESEWLLDEMLPTGELLTVKPQMTLVEGLKLAERGFDTPYRLKQTSDIVQTIVADTTSGRRVVQEFSGKQYPHVVIYTPGHREAVCIEPYTCVPDPFRMQDIGVESNLNILQPGDRADTRCVLRAEQ